MTTLTDLFGALSEVELLVKGADGKTTAERYTLGPATLGQQKEFATYLKDKVRREAAGQDPQLPEDAADRFARQAMRDIATGYYDIDSPGYVEALQRPDGMAEMLFIVLRTSHPEITREKVRALIEQGLQRAYLQVLQAEGDLDPKALAAVLAAQGYPVSWLTSSASSSSDSPTPHSDTRPGKSSD
jgi:hypothetical protein